MFGLNNFGQRLGYDTEPLYKETHFQL